MNPKPRNRLQKKAAQVAAGGRSLLSWWKDGKGVSQKLAEKRALICQSCPLNKDASLFEDLTSIAATAAKTAFEIKEKRFMKTSNEHLLGVCAACGCDLKLKVWGPVNLAYASEFKVLQEDYSDQCWVPKERHDFINHIDPESQP